MNELLPCPFCGGKAETHVKDFGDTHYWRAACEAVDCRVNPVSNVYHSEAEAIAAWNTRAGGYCAFAQPTDLTDGCALLQERTCKADYRSGGYGIGGWYCSECGGYMQDDIQQDMAYCPNCGARVVEG